jgi:glutamate formiminotransferase/formiminotetrahydrofolate cyclodeaminase
LNITRAELVGLIPQKALIETAKWYLQLNDLDDAQVLENRLSDQTPDGAASISTSPEGFIDSVAAATATPGGGAVAGLAGALSAALTQMVAGLTVGRKKYVDVSEQALRVLGDAEKLRAELTAAIAEDAAAFEAVIAVARNKELDEVAKAVSMEDATRYAGEVPLQVARLARDAGRLAVEVARIGNVNAVSDAAAGAIMARAAVQVAGLNVKINGVALRDQALAAAWRDEVAALEADAEEAAASAIAAAGERGGL